MILSKKFYGIEKIFSYAIICQSQSMLLVENFEVMFMGKTDLERILVICGVDFFATGNEYVRNALNVRFIPHGQADENVHRGIIFADANQDLLQGYSVAKYVIEYAKRGAVKFVLIGLSPYVVPENTSILEDYIQLCVDNGAKPVVVVLPDNSFLRKNYSEDILATFREADQKSVV